MAAARFSASIRDVYVCEKCGPEVYVCVYFADNLRFQGFGCVENVVYFAPYAIATRNGNMKFIKTYPSASATRLGAAVGTVTRKYAILLAMGLTASIASAVLAAVETPIGRGGRVSNSFVTVEGEGVCVADDGRIHFSGSESPVSVEVTARPGWLVDGRRSLSFVRVPGESRTLLVRSATLEDEEHVPLEDCDFDESFTNRHVLPPAIEMAGEGDRLLLVYAHPESNVLVSASASCEVVSNGVHEVEHIWLPCSECGSQRVPSAETNTVESIPGEQYWTASGAGITTNSSSWSGYLTKGLGQKIDLSVVVTNVCTNCICKAGTNVVVDVHELYIDLPDEYLGLDMRDEGRGKYVTRGASAVIEPAAGDASYIWTDCGICVFRSATNGVDVTYGATDATGPSASYRAEPLTVVATISSGELSASAACTTNFTVVAVDVTINGVGEDKEETEGAFVQYVPDAADGLWTEEGTNALVGVSIACMPEDLPPEEEVTICAPAKSLYIRHNGKYYALPEECGFPVYLLKSVEFFLHGDKESGGLRDKEIKVEHKKSGAVDLAKFTNVKLRVTNIKFNHDTGSSTRDAINIRRSYAEGINVSSGEWSEANGVITNEPCCYTTNREATVKARFEASSFIKSALIEAPCSGGGSLSGLMPTNVAFSGGVSSPEYVEFKMERSTLSRIDASKGGVLSWTASKINGGGGVPCVMNATGPHVVYTVLGEPRPPWKNAYGERENAWTNALEFAIVKAGAFGKSTDKDALAAVTAYLHSGHGLTYDTVEGVPRYWDPATRVFSATAYINVSNSASVTNFVNCYDQAYGVVTFGNLLGPVVNAVPRFTKPFGYINTTKLVGVGDCNNPFYDSTNEWQYVHITGTGSVSIGSGKPPKNPVCNVDDNTRTWFGNHMYATYHVVGDDYVFDACAGPYTGGISKTNYLNNAIDHSTIDERELSFHGGTIINLPKKDEDKPIDFPIN